MLAAITGILREHNLLEPGDEPGYNITLVSAHVLNVGAFTRGGAFFHIRVKECGSLPAEYENYCSAWQSFPRHVPEPLGRFFKNDREVIVVRGVRHRPVSVGSIARDKHGLVRKIIGFFEASNTGAQVARPAEAHGAFLRQVQERATDPTCAVIVSDWIATGRLDGLPYIGQHGDFVVNNLGLADSGLVVFDWEDFGRIVFPGLDLCTLVASDTGYSADKLCAIMGGGNGRPDTYSELLDRSCAAIGLTPGVFRQLIPLYLVIFLDLKRDYGKAIQQIISKVIHDIQEQTSRKPCA